MCERTAGSLAELVDSIPLEQVLDEAPRVVPGGDDAVDDAEDAGAVGRRDHIH